jgi:hypothetical protein
MGLGGGLGKERVGFGMKKVRGAFFSKAIKKSLTISDQAFVENIGVELMTFPKAFGTP